MITHTFTGLNNDKEYYAKVFTVNHKKRINNRADLPYVMEIPSDFPAEPTSWELVTKITNSQEFIFPEKGWFKIVVVAGAGDGGYGDQNGSGDDEYGSAGGGSGGSGGIAAHKLSTNSVQKLTINITDKSVNLLEISVNATAGTNGRNGSVTSSGRPSAGSAGSAGSASGGNISNVQGTSGQAGKTKTSSSEWPTASGGVSVQTVYEEHLSVSGTGGSGYKENAPGTSGSAAYVAIYRGNTNKG